MFTKIKTLVHNLTSRLSKKQWVIVGVGFMVFWLLGSIFMPHRISFSYAGVSCDSQIVLLPSLRRSASSATFSITHEGGLHVGAKHLVSTRSCIVAKSAPKQGVQYQRNSPFGLPLATLYQIRVPKAPALLSVPKETKIAIAKPLKLELDVPDTVYAYHLASSNTQRQKCALSGTELLCGLDKLGLAQGSDYDLSLDRSFAAESPVKIAKSHILVLPAVTVTGQSIQPDETVYAVPKGLTITVDKQLASAQAKIVEVDGDTAKPVEAKVAAHDSVVELVFAADLPREKTFKVTLSSAESADGTTLAAPHEFTFKTSGGPKVTGINIGSSGVSSTADIRISFDQVLASSQDIARFVRVDGVAGTVSYTGKEVRVVLGGAARCAAFSISVAKGILGENNLASKDDWSHRSRTNCRSTSVIGYSVNNRPITAYYYGSGSTTILFTGGIHGTEASGSYILDDWIAHLDINAYKIPAGRQVVVVPSANPDGLAANTRDNARGVNIDRNFPTANWKTDINSANGFRAGGGGVSASSEPETQALMSLTSQLHPRLEVSYHAQGSLVGASACSASADIARSYASGVGYKTMIGTAEETMGYELTGEYEEWICEAYGTPAILIELPTRTGRYLSSHLNTMWDMVNY